MIHWRFSMVDYRLLFVRRERKSIIDHRKSIIHKMYIYTATPGGREPPGLVVLLPPSGYCMLNTRSKARSGVLHCFRWCRSGSNCSRRPSSAPPRWPGLVAVGDVLEVAVATAGAGRRGKPQAVGLPLRQRDRSGQGEASSTRAPCRSALPSAWCRWPGPSRYSPATDGR